MEIKTRCRGKPELKKGQTFGKLTVVKIKKDTAICECFCGNTCEYPIKDILYGRKKTCGCRIRQDAMHLYPGQKIGEFKLIERADAVYLKETKKRWVVECVKCGSKRFVRETDIVNSRIGICSACRKNNNGGNTS